MKPNPIFRPAPAIGELQNLFQDHLRRFAYVSTQHTVMSKHYRIDLLDGIAHTLK